MESNHTSVISHLPEELLDQVIGSLCKNSRRTISACTLVSRRWLRIARPHLFATVIRPPSRAYSFSDFFDFLVFHPHIARLIENIDLSGTTRSADDPDFFLKIPYLDLQSFAALLPQLPRLQQLQVDCLRLKLLSSVYFRSPPVPLRHLTIGPSLVGSRDGSGLLCLSSFLRIFSLDTLKILHIDWSAGFPNEDYFGPLAPHSVRLNRLVIRQERAIVEFHRYFSMVLSPGALQYLETVCPDQHAVRSLHTFLDTAGTNVTHLKLNVQSLVNKHGQAGKSDRLAITHIPRIRFALLVASSGLRSPSRDRSLRLVGKAITACVNLRILGLVVPCDLDTPPEDAACTVYADIIDHNLPASCSQLRLELTINGPVPAVFERHRVALWDINFLGIFARRSPGLEEGVTVEVMNAGSFEDFEAVFNVVEVAISDVLPSIKAAGLLRVYPSTIRMFYDYHLSGLYNI